MEKLRLQFLLVFGRRFILPAAVGAIVGALIANGYSEWAAVVCAISVALGVTVTECVGG
jgi:hypothetical protein